MRQNRHEVGHHQDCIPGTEQTIMGPALPSVRSIADLARMAGAIGVLFPPGNDAMQGF